MTDYEIIPHHILNMLTNTGKKNPLITCCHSNSSSSTVILDVFCEMKHLQWNSTVCLWAKVLGPLMDRSGQPRITASSTRVDSKPLKSCGPRQASGTQPQPARHLTGRLTELHRFNSVSTFLSTLFLSLSEIAITLQHNTPATCDRFSRRSRFCPFDSVSSCRWARCQSDP